MSTSHLFIDHKRLSFVHPSCVTLPNSVLLSISWYNKDPSSDISVYTVKFFYTQYNSEYNEALSNPSDKKYVSVTPVRR